MSRRMGYYWVKHQSDWFIAFYNDLYWKIIGSHHTYKDESFDEINKSEILQHKAEPSFTIKDMKSAFRAGGIYGLNNAQKSFEEWWEQAKTIIL